MTLQEKINKAEKIGTQMAANGEDFIIPGAHKELCKMTDHMMIGEGAADIYKAYSDGYHHLRGKLWSQSIKEAVKS